MQGGQRKARLPPSRPLPVPSLMMPPLGFDDIMMHRFVRNRYLSASPNSASCRPCRAQDSDVCTIRITRPRQRPEQPGDLAPRPQPQPPAERLRQQPRAPAPCRLGDRRALAQELNRRRQRRHPPRHDPLPGARRVGRDLRPPQPVSPRPDNTSSKCSTTKRPSLTSRRNRRPRRHARFLHGFLRHGAGPRTQRGRLVPDPGRPAQPISQSSASGSPHCQSGSPPPARPVIGCHSCGLSICGHRPGHFHDPRRNSEFLQPVTIPIPDAPANLVSWHGGCIFNVQKVESRQSQSPRRTRSAWCRRATASCKFHS